VVRPALDLVIGGLDEPSLSVLEGQGDGTFSAPVQTLVVADVDGGFADLALADLNRDGRLDVIAVGARDPVVVVALGDAPLHFASPTVTEIGTAGSRIAVRDVTGDGEADVLVATGAGILLLRGSGNGTLGVAESLGTPDVVADLVVIDANRDRLPDIVAALPGRDAVRVLEGMRGGGFAAGQDVSVEEPLALAVGELTGDTALDVAVFAGRSGRVVVLPGMASGLGAPLTLADGVSATRLFSADVNGDARADLIASDAATGRVQTLIGSASLPFAVVSAGGGAPQAGIVVADFNGDGLADLVSIPPLAPAPEILPAPVPPAAPPCAGDCDHDRVVGTDELITGVRLALGDPLLSCNALDHDADGSVRIDELLAAVEAVLDGCPPAE